MTLNHDDTDSKYPDPGATMEHVCGNCGCDLPGGTEKFPVEASEGTLFICGPCFVCIEECELERKMSHAD